MKLFPVLASALFVFASNPAGAVPGGQLATLGLGAWICEIPGDASTPPSPQPEHNFTVVPDSSYVTPDGDRGTYLLLGDQLTFTSGVRAGERFVLESNATLRKQGTAPAIRCVLTGDPAAVSPASPRPTDGNTTEPESSRKP